MTDKRIVLTTAGSKDEAQNIARTLVDRHLAACVNIIGPIESVFRWQGEVQSSAEYLLIIKTMASALGAAETAIKELHSYETPEFVVLNIEAGSRQYLEWLQGCVR